MERLIKNIGRFLNVMAGMALVAMTAITCMDVMLRAFGHPILGTYEIVGLLGALLNSLALPQTTRQRGHVSVEVVVSRFPSKIRKWVYALTYFLGMFLFSSIAYAGWKYGSELRLGHEVSMTLQIPIYPFVYAIAFSAVMVSLVLFNELLNTFKNRF